jgi:hypothetical protein
MVLPLGLKLTLVTEPLCPLRVCNSLPSILILQSLTVLSLLAEAMVLPSGLKLTLVTAPLCPSRSRLEYVSILTLLSPLLGNDMRSSWNIYSSRLSPLQIGIVSVPLPLKRLPSSLQSLTVLSSLNAIVLPSGRQLKLVNQLPSPSCPKGGKGGGTEILCSQYSSV